MKHLFFVVLILILVLPHPGLAAGVFNKNFIISDEEFFNPDGMTLAEVQQFLASRNSALAHYVATDVDGALRSAAEIIWRTATTFNVNPKFFLVLLQKEQSLVDTQHLTQYQLDWATGYARCDTCSQDHPGIQDTKGLASQVYLAGQWINEKYLPAIAAKGKTAAGFGPGIVKRIDRSVNVKPANRATSILYTYTPHIAGNKHFWSLWNSWFSPLYPNGTLLQDKKSGGVWLIEAGMRRPFLSKTALTSRYDVNRIIRVETNDLDRYPIGNPVKFANYALLKSPEGKLYILADNVRREVATPTVLRALGYTTDEAVAVTAADLGTLDAGEPITTASTYPLGALFQDSKTGGIFFILDGQRRPIIDRQILTLYYKGRKIIKADETQLAQFAAADPVGFKEGEIVGFKKTKQLYLISGGARRPVTKDLLQALGFDTAQIVWASEKLLALHAVGAPVIFTTTSPAALADSNTNTNVIATDNVLAADNINAATDDTTMPLTDPSEGATP